MQLWYLCRGVRRQAPIYLLLFMYTPVRLYVDDDGWLLRGGFLMSVDARLPSFPLSPNTTTGAVRVGAPELRGETRAQRLPLPGGGERTPWRQRLVWVSSVILSKA